MGTVTTTPTGQIGVFLVPDPFPERQSFGENSLEEPKGEITTECFAFPTLTFSSTAFCSSAVQGYQKLGHLLPVATARERCWSVST